MNDALIDAVGVAAQALLDTEAQAATTTGQDRAFQTKLAMREYIFARARLDVAQIETRRAMQEDPGEGDKS